MGIINKRTRVTIGGLRVVIRPMTVNVGVYKRFGCLVMVKALRRRMRRRGVTVVIQNYYFRENDDLPGTSPEIEFLFTRGTRSTNARRTAESEFVFSTAGDDFPVVGLISGIRIRVGTEEREFSFTLGKTDPDYVPPETPRI